MKNIKRLSAFLLSTLMLITSVPLDSYATGTGGAGGGQGQGNDSGGVVTSAGGDFGVTDQGRIGIRLSLVDNADPSKVISVDETGASTVVDLLYVDQNWFNYFTNSDSPMGGPHATALTEDNTYSAVKTQDITQKNIIQPIYYPEVKSQTGVPMPHWAEYRNSAYHSKGSEFLSWCIQNDAGDAVLGGDGLLFTTDYLGNQIAVKAVRDDYYEDVTLTPEFGAGLVLMFPEDLFDSVTQLCPMGDLSAYYKNPSDAIISDFLWCWKTPKKGETTLDDLRGAAAQMKLIVSSLEQGVTILPIEGLKQYQVLTKSQVANYHTLLDSIMMEIASDGYWLKMINRNVKKTAQKESTWLDKLTGTLTVYASPVDGEDSGEDEQGTKLSAEAHIQSLLGMTYNLDGQEWPYLMTPSMKKKIADGGTYNTTSKIFYDKTGEEINLANTTEDWVLLVEPIVYLTIFKEGNDKEYIASKQYGTITNIVDAFNTKPNLKPYANRNTFNWKALNGPLWGALSVQDARNGFTFADGSDITTSSWLYPMSTVKMKYGTYYSFAQLYQEGTWHSQNNRTKAKAGYGVNLYWKNELTGGQTTEKIEDGKTYTVSKWYVLRVGDKEIIMDVQTEQTDDPQIAIVNESKSDKLMYQLEKWGTGKEAVYPETGDMSKSFEEYYNSNKSNRAGIENVSLSIAPDKVLYVKLVAMQKEETGDLTIIKVKEDENGSTVTTEKVKHPENGVYDATEPEWEYVEDYTTPSDPTNPSNWEEVPKDGTHGGNPQIPVEETTKTVYIKYEKENAPDPTTKAIELYSNELSYTYDLRDLLANRVLLSVYDSVPASPGTEKECIGHEESCDCSGDTCTSDHEYDCSSRTHHLPDGFWTVKVDSLYDYNGQTTFIRDAKQIGDTGGTWGASTTGNTIRNQKATPNLRFMLYRDSDKDKVTLYPNKNSGLKATLQGLGIDSESYTPAGSRVARVGDKDRSFRQTFETHFDYLEHDTSLRWLWPRAKCQKDNGGSYSTIPVVLPSDLNAAYSKSGNIREWYLLGTENSGTEKPRDTDEANWINRYRFNHSYSQTEAEMSFYPYVKMLYRDFADYRTEQTPQSVYVTSENLSKMKVFNTVQTGVYKKSRVNATLSSTQWSTHARSLAFLSGLQFDKKSVLPGGGILNLDMGEQGDTVLGVRLWQTALPDSQVQAVQAGFNTSVSKAKELANSYKQEVEATLSGYGLVQWGTDEITTDSEDVLNSGEELHGGVSSSLVTGNGGKTSSDAKYYLKQDGSGSNRANVDVLESRIDRQIVYTVKADVDGNVWVERDGALVGSKSKALAEILANSEVKLLDDNTKIVSNLFNALDRGLGEYGKYTRRQGEYYNEAFDGISVVLTDLSFDLGFSTGGSKRTMVLDPLLLSTAESKSELYDFEEGKVRTSAFVTTEESTTGAGGVGYLGTLGGDSSMGQLSSGLGDIQSLVNSRVFFWSNFSVSDLN